MFDIQEELRKIPGKPGVYLMHDKADSIIYVGKAINLKNRVRQYFQSSRNKGIKIEQMVTHISHFEYIVTDSELEALVLECNLIKEHHPKYNTMLMDDKAYPFIRVTIQEEFPRITLAREMKKDRAKYFGPYTSVHAVKETIELVRKLYYIRTCNRKLPRDIKKERPCLYYQIHQCNAPCQGYETKEEYHAHIEQVLKFLGGGYEEVLSSLKEKMTQASDNLEYEKAGEYLELIQNVEAIAQKQKVTDVSGNDRDILAAAVDKEDAVIQIFFIRGGRLVGRDHLYMQIPQGDGMEEILSGFIKQFYAGTPYIPSEIMIQIKLEEQRLLEEWLSMKRGSRVTFLVPQKGKKEKLVELALKNAQIVLNTDRERLKREEMRTIGALEELRNSLKMQKLYRMEAFDISNISGFAAVGSMVVYENGKPKRSDYRKFKIKSVDGPDDYASMREVLKRRFIHGLQEIRENKEGGRFSEFPDLILMDGGKGQVNIAEEVLQDMGLSIPVCGMVKDDDHRTRGLFFHNQEVALEKNSAAFRLITRIQDEAHRFAITFHRKLRGKAQIHSILDDIPGVGPARRKALMKSFENIEAIKNASVEEIAALPSMTRLSAESIYHFFHEDKGEAIK